jgi:hypothetical chaperone protein
MIGFDYGTSNCAVGVMQNGIPSILSLGEHGKYVSSTLYAPSREVIVNWLQQQLSEKEQQKFHLERKLQLNKGINVLRELKFDGISSELFFGKQALQAYLADPEEGYYIKSPKSFLGASGLFPQQVQLFEDIVAAMMANIKKLAEQNLDREITQTVIGRPINFQGSRGEESNQQAINVLTNAAKRVGFKDIEFQFEPVAAGFEFEASLTKETKVLVVDIGGGTTDCSMLLMGPELQKLSDRTQHLLSHSGERIGGNDFDIGLSLAGIMPELGINSFLKSGKPMPVNSFYQAVAINKINEQNDFYSAENQRFLSQLVRDSKQPEQIERLLKVQTDKLSYLLVNSAEQAKIALTDQDEFLISLESLDENLTTPVSRNTLLTGIKRELNGIANLMHEAVEESSEQPDVIFITGGTAKSPVLNAFFQKHFPNTPIVLGDHFGSVTAGLTRWAHKVFI